ncbi:MAG: type IV pilin protein [Halioglobus sp.]
MAKQGKRFGRGFTLIEIMIVVAIVAVLLTVALPSFQDQIIRANRSAAQAQMLDIANRQQQYVLSNRSYMDKTTLESSGFVLDPDVLDDYTYDITVGSGAVPTYIITFEPYGRQANDPNMTLNEQGVGGPEDLWKR